MPRSPRAILRPAAPRARIVGPDGLEEAVAVLQRGGLVAFPTDTVYGVAALPARPEAVLALYRAAGRTPQPALPVLIAEVEEVNRLAASVPQAAKRLAKRFWPGPLTLIFRRSPAFRGPGAAEDDTVGVRLPAHELARALARAAGGVLAVTNAASPGAAGPLTAEEAAGHIGSAVDLIIDGGPCPGGALSSVVDCSRSPLRLVREAALSRAEISRYARVTVV